MGVAKATFIPHHANNHWPLALRHHTLAYTSLFLILTKIVAVTAFALAPHIAELSTITDARMLQLTNQARTEAGLPPLALSNALAQAAKQKGQDMLKHQYFAHISPTGVTPWFWMKKAGYSYQMAGENLAIDFVDAENVVQAWIDSPTHKANLLHSEYTQTGIAVVSGEFQGGTSTIVVHMFGSPLLPAVAGTEEPSLQPTPAPIATTLPTPAPLPAPMQPRTPRISLLHTPTHNDDVVTFSITGDENDSAVLVIGSEERSITTLPKSGSIEVTIAAKHLPRGTLVAKAFSRSISGTESAHSSEISFVNPDTPPAAAPEYSITLSPAFDRQQIALASDDESVPWQLFSIDAPLTINADVIDITPSFTLHENAAAQSFSASILHTSRQVTAIILITISCLLAIAVLVSIRIQHPALIMHASSVIVLATILLIA